MGEIVVFSKSKCPHCVEVKQLLSELDIPFTDIDVEVDPHNGMLMALVSGRHTVPQIFFNETLIGGAEDLRRLGREQIERRAEQALRTTGSPDFLSRLYTKQELEAAIIPIKEVLDPHLPEDPTGLPEYEPVRIWYSRMFGFLCNLYDQMSLAPEPMALWIGVLSSMMALVERQVGASFGISCLATANAARCSYCSAHGADLAIKYAGRTPENIQELFEYLQGRRPLDELAFDDRLKAIVVLSAGMTTGDIDRTDLERARAAFGCDHLRDAIESIGGMGCIMGFLNRFNDLIGVEIEASIKQTIDNSALAADWEWGTHDTADTVNRHDFRDQQPGRDGPGAVPPFRELVEDVQTRVIDALEGLREKYGACDSHHVPAWVSSFPGPEPLKSVEMLYHSAFNAGTLSPETKHLAAWVLCLGTNHDAIASEELRIARQMAADPARLEARLEELRSFAVAGRLPDDTLLSPSEIAAMRLARVAQRFPHEVPGGLVLELADHLGPRAIVELVIALSVVGMGQRWVNINRAFADYAFGQASAAMPLPPGSAEAVNEAASN